MARAPEPAPAGSPPTRHLHSASANRRDLRRLCHLCSKSKSKIKIKIKIKIGYGYGYGYSLKSAKTCLN